MNDQLQTSQVEISPVILNAISSRASEDGVSRLNLLDGPQTNPCGPEAVRANHSQMPEQAKALLILDISGQSSTDSLPVRPSDLQQFLESRLRAQLDVDGSPEYALTWKHWDIASGPPICALRASGHHTLGKDFIGWATPAARDHRTSNSAESQERRNEGSKRGQQLPNQVMDILRTPGMTSNLSDLTGKENTGVLNPGLPRWLLGFPKQWVSCAPSATRSSRSSQRNS